MGQVSLLNQRRTQQLSPSMTVEAFDVGTKDGHSYVGLQFEQRLPSGGVREFRTDVERLEAIEKRVADYAASGDREERHEQVGDMHVWMKRDFFKDRGEAVGVQLGQKSRDGSDEVQRIGTFADSLKRAVDVGKNLEQELGYDQRWHVLVAARSITKDESGRIQAQVVGCFDSEDKARDHMERSSGSLVLSLEPQRREFSQGDTVELFPDTATVMRGEHQQKSVEDKLDQADWLRSRESENFVIAKWDDKYNQPRMDARTKYDGMGFDGSSLEPKDFQAGYSPNREQGELGEPKWVLIEKDANKFGVGNIRGISGDRDALVEELKREEGHKQDVQQAVGRDWEKQSFGMDRDQFTQGHSM